MKYSNVFCGCPAFLKALLQVLQGFWISHSETYLPEVSNEGEAFSSHKCYEIGLYFLMTFVENSIIMKHLFKTLVEMDLLKNYLHLLGANLASDISYHTQV